ncbi:MAG TPA: hypothetical protein DCM40_26300, partial [Maribacter sp.]|nr:hypothetical protein [Maribacter sp.]
GTYGFVLPKYTLGPNEKIEVKDGNYVVVQDKKEEKEEDVLEKYDLKISETIPYKISESQKNIHNSNIEDISKIKEQLKDEGVSFTSDLDAVNKYYEKYPPVAMGESDPAVETYDPNIEIKSTPVEIPYTDPIQNKDLYDENGNLKRLKPSNENELTLEQFETLNFFLEKGDGKYFQEDLRDKYLSGEIVLRGEQFEKANKEYKIWKEGYETYHNES